MKLTPNDVGRTVAYVCQSGTGTGRIASLGVRTIAGRSAFMEDLTGPLDDGSWTWIHEKCLFPIPELHTEENTP